MSEYFGWPAARGAIVFEADLTESDERAQSPDEPRVFGKVAQGVHDLTVHQAEITAVERDFQVADRIQDAIKGVVARA